MLDVRYHSHTMFFCISRSCILRRHKRDIQNARLILIHSEVGGVVHWLQCSNQSILPVPFCIVSISYHTTRRIARVKVDKSKAIYYSLPDRPMRATRPIVFFPINFYHLDLSQIIQFLECPP